MLIKFSDISDSHKVLLYGDFNVLNILYESNTELPESIAIYPDSTLVYFILKYFLRHNVHKNVSTDFQNLLLYEALRTRKKIFFFGDSYNTLSIIKNKLHLDESCIYPGYDFDNINILEHINRFSPDILFVGLGAGRQEKWIIDNYASLNAGTIISTGGWFAYLSDIKKRAPLWIRKIHLEWFYKLANEFPRVSKRYFCGAPLFIYRILLKKIVLEFE